MIAKKQIVDFIKKHSSFESIIEACQSSPGCYAVRFLKNAAKLEFDDDFSDWRYVKIAGDERLFIYAKVGAVHHKKFNRELGFIFVLNDEDKIESIQGFLVQNIRSRLTSKRLMHK